MAVDVADTTELVSLENSESDFKSESRVVDFCEHGGLHSWHSTKMIQIRDYVRGGSLYPRRVMIAILGAIQLVLSDRSWNLGIVS